MNNDSHIPLLPKQAIVIFRELNKAEMMKDPYENFTTDILPVVTRNILTDLMGVENPASWSFFQKGGTFESDFILVFNWRKFTDRERLVPERIQRFFELINVGIPFIGTSGLFEAKLLSNPKHETKVKEIRVNGSPFKLIFKHTNYRIPSIDRFKTEGLRINKLVMCNRVVLNSSEFNISNEFISLLSEKE